MIKYIIGALGLLIGWFGFSKAKSAGALLENLDTKKELNKADQSITKNDGLKEAEAAKQAEIQKEIDAPKETKSDEELASIFNKKK
jgi:Xaa-Pro aminopeptidase